VGSELGVAYATHKLESHGVRHRLAGCINLGDSGSTIDNEHLEEFRRAIAGSQPWEVLIAAPPAMMARIEEAIRPFVPRSMAVRFAIYPLLDEPRAQDVTVLPGDMLTMRVKPDSLGSRYALARRIMDIPIALLVLILTAPLMLLVAIAIKIDSPGPVLFRQTRVGRDGRTFTMYKFRSMHENAEEMRDQLEELNEADGPLFKLRHDPRVTRVGRVIRRLSLDELPQFFNVLEGTMGVVGPRPALPNEVAEYEPWQMRRLVVLPGITGLWQVSRKQCSSFEEMIWLDIEYVEKWSPMLDLSIVAKTIPAMITARGAY
jgi:exopolysaccharide biosynthesis polyprenyl glycosylphosphotransferase